MDPSNLTTTPPAAEQQGNFAVLSKKVLVAFGTFVFGGLGTAGGALAALASSTTTVALGALLAGTVLGLMIPCTAIVGYACYKCLNNSPFGAFFGGLAGIAGAWASGWAIANAAGAALSISTVASFIGIAVIMVLAIVMGLAFLATCYGALCQKRSSLPLNEQENSLATQQLPSPVERIALLEAENKKQSERLEKLQKELDSQKKLESTSSGSVPITETVLSTATPTSTSDPLTTSIELEVN